MRHKHSHGAAVSSPSRPWRFPPRRGLGVQEACYHRNATRSDRPHGEPLRGLNVVGRLTSKALRYGVIKHAETYDVVRGHHRTLVVRDHRRYVKGHQGTECGATAWSSASITSSSSRECPCSLQAHLPRRPSSPEHHCRSACRRRPAACGPVTRPSPATTVRPARAGRQVRAPSLSGGPWISAPKDRVRGQGCLVRGQADVSYRIETSLDGVAFTTVADRSENQIKGATTDALAVVARYVRISVLGVSPSGVNASAYEITVNGDAGTTPPPTPTRPRRPRRP